MYDKQNKKQLLYLALCTLMIFSTCWMVRYTSVVSRYLVRPPTQNSYSYSNSSELRSDQNPRTESAALSSNGSTQSALSATGTAKFNETHDVPICEQYRQEIHLVRTVFTYVFGETNSSSDVVCLLTQMSSSRVDRLQKIAEHWQGCISVAVYVTKQYQNITRQMIARWLVKTERTNVAVHFVITKGRFYPINFLRNVALRNTQATFVLMIDADFLPSKDLHDNILNMVGKKIFSNKKKAIVVPALQMNNSTQTFPATKADVIEQYNKQNITFFHAKKYGSGHWATNTSRWIKTSQMYPVFYKGGYEPYAVLSRNVSPMYSERFLHRYFNKSSYTYQLFKEGWSFYVMPNGYLIHMHHKSELKQTRHMFSCAKQELMQFHKEVARNMTRQNNH